MKTSAEAELARRDLDQAMRKWRRLRTVTPKRGWICEIRQALGMTGVDLAKRLEVSPSAISVLERSEAMETIQLATLKRVASALECNLMYALVPKMPMARLLLTKRRRIALKELSAVLPPEQLLRVPFGFVNEYAKQIKDKRVWREG
jgi:predicted DNA-binding mobile mystery protein A